MSKCHSLSGSVCSIQKLRRIYFVLTAGRFEFFFIPRARAFAYTHVLVNTISAFNEHGEIFTVYDNEYVLVYSHLFAVIAYRFCCCCCCCIK